MVKSFNYDHILPMEYTDSAYGITVYDIDGTVVAKVFQDDQEVGVWDLNKTEIPYLLQEHQNKGLDYCLKLALSDFFNKNEIILLKNEDLNKAIGDIQPGKHLGEEDGKQKFDYSHLLSPEHQKAGYSMHLYETPHGNAEVWLNHYHDTVGMLEGAFGNKSVRTDIASMHQNYRGMGLGQKMYESLFAHGKHVKGAVQVEGDIHSSDASRVHQKLSQKHGMSYAAKPNIGNGKYPTLAAWQSAPQAGYDQKFGPYAYALKTSEEFNKTVEDWVKAKNVKP